MVLKEFELDSSLAAQFYKSLCNILQSRLRRSNDQVSVGSLEPAVDPKIEIALRDPKSGLALKEKRLGKTGDDLTHLFSTNKISLKNKKSYMFSTQNITNIVYTNCFSGKDLVTFLASNGFASSRTSALHLGLKLLHARVFHHIEGGAKKISQIFFIYQIFLIRQSHAQQQLPTPTRQTTRR